MPPVVEQREETRIKAADWTDRKNHMQQEQRSHPEEGYPGVALVLDALVALLALAALGYASEWWIRRQKAKSVGPACR